MHMYNHCCLFYHESSMTLVKGGYYVSIPIVGYHGRRGDCSQITITPKLHLDYTRGKF